MRRAGSRGHEPEDAASFAAWDVDFLKYDNCWAPPSDWVVDRYTAMRDALNATGRPILYSMCDWGVGDPWLWADKARAPLLAAPPCDPATLQGLHMACMMWPLLSLFIHIVILIFCQRNGIKKKTRETLKIYQLDILKTSEDLAWARR
jgi:hypothetical protein